MVSACWLFSHGWGEIEPYRSGVATAINRSAIVPNRPAILRGVHLYLYYSYIDFSHWVCRFMMIAPDQINRTRIVSSGQFRPHMRGDIYYSYVGFPLV